MIYDSPLLAERPHLVLQPEEIAEAFWLPPEEAVARHVARGRTRLAAALSARTTGRTAFVDDVVTLPSDWR